MTNPIKVYFKSNGLPAYTQVANALKSAGFEKESASFLEEFLSAPSIQWKSAVLKEYAEVIYPPEGEDF